MQTMKNKLSALITAEAVGLNNILTVLLMICSGTGCAFIQSLQYSYNTAICLTMEDCLGLSCTQKKQDKCDITNCHQ